MARTLSIVDLLDGAVLAVAGVVDEGADRAVRRLDLGDRRGHRRLVGDVERRHVGAHGGEVGQRLGAAGGGPHGVALAEQRPRRRRGRCRSSSR